ncbi:hypothetical protein ACF0H5_006789 [Mactra antiquata]
MKTLTLLWIVLLINVSCCYDNPLSKYLWQQTGKQQQESLNTKMIQGVMNKNLDPSKFGAYMVQDSVYCYHSMKVLAIANSKVKDDPTLKQFFNKTYASYQVYTSELLKAWHIGEPTTIDLGPACSNYVNHLYDVARNMEPIYLVVAMTPCAKLWPWIGVQLNTSTGNFGVYTDWVKENFNENSKGYQKYDIVIDSAQKRGLIDQTKALDVYSKSMDNEVAFFNLDEFPVVQTAGKKNTGI